MRFALYTKLDQKENNDHIFSVLKSLQKYKIDFDIDGDTFDQLSEITNGLAFRLCGAIGVKTKFLLSGIIIGPPQLKEYPVDPVGVDIIRPSAQ